MIQPLLTRILSYSAIALGALLPSIAIAIDWNISGLVRQEIAYSIAGNNNELNQMGNVFNHRITPHYTHAGWGSGANAAAPTTTFINGAGVGGFFQKAAVAALPVAPSPGQLDIKTVAAGAATISPVDCRFAHLNAVNVGSAGLAASGGFRGVLCPNGGGALRAWCCWCGVPRV